MLILHKSLFTTREDVFHLGLHAYLGILKLHPVETNFGQRPYAFIFNRALLFTDNIIYSI